MTGLWCDARIESFAASQKNILGVAAALRSRIGPKDKLVIYTTGHGTRIGGRVDEGEAFVYARRRHPAQLDRRSSNAQWRTSGFGSS